MGSKTLNYSPVFTLLSEKHPMQKNRFNGRLIKVIEKKQLLPNGVTVNLEIVKHPGAALIVPFLSPRTVIFLKQYRPLINTSIYELPAGTLAKAEKHISCARRELLEETGYTAGRFLKLGEIYPACGYTTEKIVIYKAQILKKSKFCPEKDEIIETHILTKSAVRRIFKARKIIDAKTICALAMCGWL